MGRAASGWSWRRTHRHLAIEAAPIPERTVLLETSLKDGRIPVDGPQ